MMKGLIGYRFSPTGEEVINHYLKNKLLGKYWLVDEAISEINILSHKPSKDLPSKFIMNDLDLSLFVSSSIISKFGFFLLLLLLLLLQS
jgi:hypothetical protein